MEEINPTTIMYNQSNQENQEILVCINCITYNHEAYIKQCLDGFVMQKTTFRFEAIVHDDASTDGTANIIRKYANEYPDIIKPIFEYENQWSKHDGTLNRIMDEATCHSKYVAFCEGDDFWTDPYKLQKQVDAMESNPKASLCYSAVNTVDENQELIIREGIESFIREAPQGDVYKRLFAGNFIMTVSTMFRQEVFSSWVYKHCPIRLDYFLFLNAAFQGDVIFINERMCSYRKTPTGAMATKSQWVGEQSFHTKEFFILMSSIGIVSKQSDPHLSKMDGLIRYLRFAQHLEFEKKILGILLKQGKVNILSLFRAYLRIRMQNFHHKITEIF